MNAFAALIFYQLFCQLHLAENRIIIYILALVIRDSKAYCVYNLLAKSHRLILAIIPSAARKLSPAIFAGLVKNFPAAATVPATSS
jgi:hypothetical protein